KQRHTVHLRKAQHKAQRSRNRAKRSHATETAGSATGGRDAAPAIGPAVVADPPVTTPELVSASTPAGTIPIVSTPTTSAVESTTPAESTESTTPAESNNPSPSVVPLTVGIDGGYSGWWSEEIELRQALNAPVTRHQWEPLEELVSA